MSAQLLPFPQRNAQARKQVEFFMCGHTHRIAGFLYAVGNQPRDGLRVWFTVQHIKNPLIIDLAILWAGAKGIKGRRINLDGAL